MPNFVISSTFIKQTLSKAGREIIVKYATDTSAWKRLALSPIVQQKYVEAIEKADIPPDATTAIMTETEHSSEKDAYPHYTTVYLDKDGNHLTTKHVYP